MLETARSQANAFVTLTYSPESLPTDGSLKPADLRAFLNRLRTAYRRAYDLKFRYFAVGEYGDSTLRPHYHIALFNYPSCSWGRSRYSTRPSCCESCDRIRDAWGLGNIDVGTLGPESAAYISGYVVKKLTGKNNPLLKGRHNEFARMSLKPGIGAHFVDHIASTLIQHDLEHSIPDVPAALRHGKRILPLGRYLRKRLRKAIGRDEKTPQVVLEAQAQELQDLRQIAWDAQTPLSEVIKMQNGGLEDSLKSRLKLKGKKL